MSLRVAYVPTDLDHVRPHASLGGDDVVRSADPSAEGARRGRAHGELLPPLPVDRAATHPQELACTS